MKKINESPETLFLKLIHVLLVGYTEIRAHNLRRVEQSSWVVVSKANLSIPLGEPGTPSGKEVELDSRVWSNIPLPNNVPPTFETCNMSRKYEIEISVGLAFGSSKDDIKPETTVQALRMPVQVYSGIPPPEALLEEMARQQGLSATVPSPSAGEPVQTPPAPPRPGAQPPPADAGEEPPPSYEDAMADELAPVDGSSRPTNYEQPEGQPVGDQKRSNVFRRNDRLFP